MCQNALESASVFFNSRCDSELGADELPKVICRPRARLARRVEATGAVLARFHPAIGCEYFQVPADGGLGKLQRRAEFRDRKFLALQEQENPTSDRITKGDHAIEYRVLSREGSDNHNS